MNALMSKKCIKLIETYLNKHVNMLEIGSGGSTCLFAKQVNKLYSIESDECWYNAVTKEIEKQNIINIDYRLVKSNMKDENKGGIYWTYNMYKDYVDEINKFETKFDIIFIDGMARQHCYVKAFNQLKDDGYVIIHDYYSVGNILDKHWHTDILKEYYEEVESIREYGKKIERGNDVIILKKRKKIIDNVETLLKKMDATIPRA